ncbi:YhbY family RNA-binding protein [Gammaproteobacteria bacterium]|nr:YhbY family RNA-binding protein [Gammaproteobacteria bacterium]|tara:strand:+ start:99 stop:395 length:297 start_codon:yes stop_codon:yes gene_type:complete
MDKKALKAIAHHLNPIVTIGNLGLSTSVIAELNRAISDHELIKVRLNIVDRKLRVEFVNEVSQLLDAKIVQQVGKVVVLYRPNEETRPALSNITRFGQ